MWRRASPTAPRRAAASAAPNSWWTKNEITYPKVTQPDFLLTLTQASLDKFGANTSEDALIMIDKSLLEPDDLGSYNVVSLPILHTATRVVGKPMTANIVAVGAINELLAIRSRRTRCARR